MATPSSTEAILAQFPELKAEIETIRKSGASAINQLLAIEMAMMKETDSRGNPRYTQEQIKQVSDELRQTGFLGGYGTFEETAVKPIIGEVQYPQSIPAPQTTFAETLGAAYSPQAYILEGDTKGTTAYGKFEEAYDLTPEINEILPMMMKETYGLQDDETVGIYVESFKSLYAKERGRGKTQQQALDATMETINNMKDVPKIGQGNQEGDVSILDTLQPRFTEIGGKYPDYNHDQMEYLQNIKSGQVNQYIAKQMAIDKEEKKRSGRSTNIEIPFYRVQVNGKSIDIPVEVYNYFERNKQLSADVYTGSLKSWNDDLREYFTQTPSLQRVLPKTEIRYSPSDIQQSAVYKVEAFKKIGGDEWYLDALNKSLVMTNPEAYRELASTFRNIVSAETSILGGGTVETTPGYGMRVLMSMPTALTVGTIEYGLYPALDMMLGTDIETATKEQRATYQPKYEDYPVLGAIALDKGLVGYVGDALDAYGVVGAERKYIDWTLIGIDILLNPDVAAVIGAFKGVMGLSDVKNINNARKALGEATTATDYAKVLAMKPIQSVMNELNGVSLVAKKIAPQKVENIKNWKVGDGRILLEADVAKSLDASRIAKLSDDPIQALYDNDLYDTGYGKALRKYVDEQGVDGVTAVKKLDEIYTANKGLDEYFEFNKVLQDARAVGFEDAIKNAKMRGAVADLDYLSDVHKRSDNGFVGQAIESTQEKINRIYARKIVFENTPKVKGLDNIQFVSTKAAVHYEAYPEFLAKTKADSRMKVLTKNITKKTKSGKEISLPKITTGRYVSGDIGYTKSSLGKKELVFYPDANASAELQNMIETLPLSSSTYDRIKGTLQEGKLFQSDYNLLVDNIKTSVAKEMEAGMTTADISKLGMKQQRRLLEARGTSYRSGSPLVDFLESVKENGFIGTAQNFKKVIESKLKGKAPKVVLEKMNKPNIGSANSVVFGQRQLINNIKRQSSMLDNRLNDDIKNIIKSPETQELYGVTGEIDSVSGMGYLIIGKRQVDDMGVIKQTQGLKDTLDWMYRQLIYGDYEVSNMTYYDRNFSTKQVVIENIYSPEGKKKYDEFLSEVASEIMENKQNFWDIFGQRGEEWSRKIKKDRIDIFDKKDPTKIIRTEPYFKISTELDPRTIRDLSIAEIDAQMEKISMGSYFYAEMRRVHDELLVGFLDDYMKPTDVQTLFRGKDVSQETFDNLLRTNIHMLATVDNVDVNVMSSLREYADLELRYKSLRDEFGTDGVAKLESEIVDKLKEYIGDKEFDARFEKMYEQMKVTEGSQIDLIDTLENLKIQYDLDIASIRNTKERKIEQDLAPIREQYQKKIDAAKEAKEASVFKRIDASRKKLEDEALAPILERRTKELKEAKLKYDERVKRLDNARDTELLAIRGKKYTTEEVNSLQAEIKSKYGKKSKSRKDALAQYKSRVQFINDEYDARKLSITENFDKRTERTKEKYRALPEDQKEKSKVKQLREELNAKEREVRNKYEKERSQKAKDLFELRKEIEAAERKGLSERNEELRQQIRDKWNAELEKIQEEYKSVRQQGLMAQVNWLDSKIDISGTDIAKAQEILSTASDAELIRDLAYKANDYATTILNNNNILSRTGFTANDYDRLVHNMFRDNPDWGRMIFGEREFAEFERQLSRYGTERTNKTIREWLNQTKADNAVESVKMFLGTLQQMFYLGTLGFSLRSHGTNITTGSFITYTTTGQRIKSVDTGQQALKTMLHGSSDADPKAFDIAVRTPTGDVYTYRDIYDAIVKGGVRTQYNAIKQVLSDGQILRYLQANNKKFSGFNNRFMTKMRDMLGTKMDQASELLVKEDMVFRSGAMIEALKEGMSFEEATQVARRSLFDYNDLTDAERAVSTYAFVFYNFTRQSFVDMVIGMQNPDTLKRYLNMFKLHRDNQQFMISLNDDKRFPHEVFFPQYTAVRNIASYTKTSDENTYDWFTMTSSLPAVESFALLVDALQLYGTLQDDNPITINVDRFLDPKWKWLFGSGGKYEAKRFPEEWINILKLVSSDQEELLAWMQLIVGGEVKPRIADPEDYAVSGVGDDFDKYYIYDLDDRQMKRLKTITFMFQQIGMKRITDEYSKMFISREGTSWQAATPLQMTLTNVGLLTPGRMKKPEIQQAEQLDKVLKEYQRRINASNKQTEQQLKP
jgi:hypothetical protein